MLVTYFTGPFLRGYFSKGYEIWTIVLTQLESKFSITHTQEEINYIIQVHFYRMNSYSSQLNFYFLFLNNMYVNI